MSPPRSRRSCCRTTIPRLRPATLEFAPFTAPQVRPAVDIYVTAPGADLETALPVLTSVEFGDVADYLEVPAGDYQVRVTPAGTKVVALDSGTLTLESGQVRTVIAVDAPGGGAPFDLLVLADLN